MTLSDSTREKIEGLVGGNRVVLFMKGTPKSPMCGFSSKTVGLLDSILGDYTSVDVLEDLVAQAYMRGPWGRSASPLSR